MTRNGYTRSMAYLESEEMIGHSLQRGFLARSLKNTRHHAFLLVGPEHLGKDTVARALIAGEVAENSTVTFKVKGDELVMG